MQSVSSAGFRALGDELLRAVRNVNTTAVYLTRIEPFLDWWEKADTGFLNRDLGQAQLRNLVDLGLSANTINQRLSAEERFAGLAVDAGLIDLSTAADIDRVRSILRSTKPHQLAVEATPEDLRRTCARRCRDQGGEPHHIQMMLGHASVESTEPLLGRHEVAGEAPNMLVRMKWYRSSKVVS